MEQQEDKTHQEQRRLRDGDGAVMMRVVHPHHPLSDEIVNGLWQVEGVGYGSEREKDGRVGVKCWVVERAGGERLRVPETWVRMVGADGDDHTTERRQGKELGLGRELRADVAGLLDLANMVQEMQVKLEADSLPEVCDESSIEIDPASLATAAAAPSCCKVGETAAAATTGGGVDAGGDAAQTIQSANPGDAP